MTAPDEHEKEFRTTDKRVAMVARATHARLVDFDKRNPSRIVFIFRGVPGDFDERIERGEIKVDAAAMIDAMEAVERILIGFRRDR